MEVWYVIGSIIFGLLVGISVYLVSRKVFCSSAQIIVEQSKAKAKAIEYEAQKMLQEHQLRIKEEQINVKQFLESERNKLHQEYESRSAQLVQNENRSKHDIKQQMLALEKEKQKLSEMEVKILRTQEEQNKLKEEYYQAKKEMLEILFSYTKMTQEEAKNIILSSLEDELSNEKAYLIRRYEKEAHDEAKKHANYILAQATTRYAGNLPQND